MAELILLCRTYLNINLGLEPNFSQHFVDRKAKLRENGFELIENVRKNMHNW